MAFKNPYGPSAAKSRAASAAAKPLAAETAPPTPVAQPAVAKPVPAAQPALSPIYAQYRALLRSAPATAAALEAKHPLEIAQGHNALYGPALGAGRPPLQTLQPRTSAPDDATRRAYELASRRGPEALLATPLRAAMTGEPPTRA